MAEILVLYYTKGGNTRKLAEAIAEGAGAEPGCQVNLCSVAEVTKADFLNANAVIAGSPVYFGTMAAELKAIFDQFVSTRRQMENKIGAAFATSADPTGGKETTIFSIIQALMIYGMIVVGDPMDASGHYGVACVGAPDNGTAQNGRKLGRRVAALAAKLRD